MVSNFVGLNDTLTAIVNSLFGMDKNINVFFHIDSSLPSHKAGNASYDVASSNFIGHIYLNPIYLSPSNEESILGTIIHELLHVTMSYYIDLNNNNLISDSELSSILPVYFACNSPTSNFETCSHEEMAANYVELMAETLQNFNQDLTNHEALGIAWVGLQETEYWQNNIPNDDKNLILVAQGNISIFPESTNVTPCE